MITDRNKLEGKYKLGIVVATKVSSEGLICSATVQYFNRRGVVEMWSAAQVVRSVQRLMLTLLMEEQVDHLMVRDDGAYVQVCKVS